MRHILPVISVLIVAGLLTGCAGMSTEPSDDSARTARILFNVAEGATLLALKGKPDCTEFSKGVKKEIDIVRDTLSDPDAKITSAVLDALIAKLENLNPEYKILMRSALDTLHEFVKVPQIDGILSPDAIVFLEAFFNGVNSGLEFEINK